MTKRAARAGERTHLATPAKDDAFLQRKFNRMFKPRATASPEGGSLFSTRCCEPIPAADIVEASEYRPAAARSSVVMSFVPSERSASHAGRSGRARTPAQLKKASAELNRSIERAAAARGAVSLPELFLGLASRFVALRELVFPAAAVQRAAELAADARA